MILASQPLMHLQHYGLPVIVALNRFGSDTLVALEEIWSTTVARAGAEASAEQTSAIFLAQVDGLGYEQIVRLAGPGAKQRYARVMESPSTLTWMMWTGAGD